MPNHFGELDDREKAGTCSGLRRCGASLVEGAPAFAVGLGEREALEHNSARTRYGRRQSEP